MKYRFLGLLIVFIAVLAFQGCKGNSSGSSSKKQGENFDKDASYALGMNIGSNLLTDNIIPNMDEFIKGLEASIKGGKTRFTEMEAMEKIEAAYYTMMEKKKEDDMQKSNEFLAENSKKPGIKMTSSGLQYEVITETNGRKPLATDVVRVHYEGRLINGSVFDSSYDRGSPAEFPLDGVIPGWTEGVQLMGVGSKYRLYIPSELGYGEYGGGAIPPNSALIFDVELLDIVEN